MGDAFRERADAHLARGEMVAMVMGEVMEMGQRERASFDLPEGFESVLRYPDGATGVPVPGLARLRLEDAGRYLSFNISDGAPSLPLKTHGELDHSGWDIPTRYAIDAAGQCWMDNAHGHPLARVDADELLGAAEEESDANDIRRALGQEIPMPEWAQAAIRAGFTPPDGWTWRKS